MTITVTDLRHATNPLTPNKDSLTFLKLFIQLSINCPCQHLRICMENMLNAVRICVKCLQK